MELFDVHVLGFEVSEERATRALMRVFGLNEAAARLFVQSVPRIGKRRVPKESAERYIRALHAVGAIVECRGCRPSSAEASVNASLPAPTVSSFPGTAMPHIMQDSFGVMAPVAYSPHMPQIPKAPRVPADLQAIRARKGPDSLAPHWRPAESPDRRASSPRAPSGPEADLKSPNPDAVKATSGPGAAMSPAAIEFETSLGPEDGSSVSHAEAPGEEPLGSAAPPPETPSQSSEHAWYARPSYQLILAALIVGSVTVTASSGLFQSDASRLGREFARAGIDAGQFERASMFLAADDTGLEDATKPEAKRIVDALLAAGGVSAWFTGIARKGDVRTANRLLVELPEDAAARKRVLDAYAKVADAGASEPPAADQRFLSVEF